MRKRLGWNTEPARPEAMAKEPDGKNVELKFTMSSTVYDELDGIARLRGFPDLKVFVINFISKQTALERKVDKSDVNLNIK
jgi:hypothetical protein